MTATTVYVRPDGPYIFTGDFSLDARGAPRDNASVVLCRCGHSSNKPYCDGTHRRIGFVDAGVVPLSSEPNRPLAVSRLTIIPVQNGPLNCVGPMAVSGANGQIRVSRDLCLCRCGGSSTKPFCDGTHNKTGFVT
jgi:CDGSH-type Zn-finger protein